MIGQYPREQGWRVASIVWLANFLLGVTWGRFGGAAGTFAKACGVVFVFLALLPLTPQEMHLLARAGLLANPVLIAPGYLLGRFLVRCGRWLLVGWLLFAVAAFVLVAGVGRSRVLLAVESGLWGGLLLTFLLAFIGITLSLPIGSFSHSAGGARCPWCAGRVRASSRSCFGFSSFPCRSPAGAWRRRWVSERDEGAPYGRRNQAPGQRKHYHHARCPRVGGWHRAHP